VDFLGLAGTPPQAIFGRSTSRDLLPRFLSVV
jgi:hypothetical protein